MSAHGILSRALLVALVCAAAPAGAIDVTVLQTPGAVHLPGQDVAPTAPASGVPGIVAPAQAASARSARQQVVQIPAVRMTGYIMPGDSSKVRDVLEQLSRAPAVRPNAPLSMIELSSMGGNLYEGFEIGSLLRKYRMVAVVRASDFCLSSCALAFLGGNVPVVPQSYPTRCNVEIGGKVGFHNFFLNPAGLRDSTATDPVTSRLQGFSDARGGAARLVRYSADMGLPPSFVASLMGRPVDDFQYIETVGQFLNLGVCPVDLKRPSLPLEEQAANVCRNSLREANPALQLEARLLQPRTARRYLLERVQTQMQSSRSRGRLAKLLGDGAVMRVESEIDRLYDDLQAAGIALPDIVGPIYEIGRDKAGTFEPACYVSLSPDNPDSFDVVLVGARGLAEAIHLPPENARRLFLYSRDAVVNPKP